LDAIRAWGADIALSLIVEYEFVLLRVPRLGEGFGSRGIAWRHLPIQDLGPPDEAFHAAWSTDGAAAVSVLRAGGKVLVHCRGGLGRAGTVACMLLIELGASRSEALRKVRAARLGAVETPTQERYLVAYSPRILRAGS
jgi:protein-tyrosine phosphatase